MTKGVKGFQKGHPKIGGRKVGARNKFTCLKAAFVEAFKEIGAAQGLIDWIQRSNENQKVFYTLIGRMLPAEMRTKSDDRTDLRFSFAGFKDSMEKYNEESGAKEVLMKMPRPAERMSDRELDAEIARLKKAKGETHERAQRAVGRKKAKAKS